MRTPELVLEGQAALGRADWARARECFEHALEQDLLSPGALVDAVGRGLHFQPEYARAIELTERAEAALVGVGKCAAHGWPELDRAPLTGEVRRRERLAASALVVARQFADSDLAYDTEALEGLWT